MVHGNDVQAGRNPDERQGPRAPSPVAGNPHHIWCPERPTKHSPGILNPNPSQPLAAALPAMGKDQWVAVPLPVLCEFFWVLRRVYGFTNPDCIAAIETLVARWRCAGQLRPQGWGSAGSPGSANASPDRAGCRR
jgi:hypothetical protein